MLTYYQQTTRRFLNDVTFVKYDDFDLRDWINQARGQIAGEAECIRNYATLLVSNAAQQYPFSAVTLATGTTGVAGPLNVRKITYLLATGQARMYSREWEWFENYELGNPSPIAGQPKYWAQFGQGANGTIFVNLLDGAYTLMLDTVCWPNSLMTDSDPEAIPYLWTDAVPYYAAYLGYLTAQDTDRATGMFKFYQMFMGRARAAATPSDLPHQFAQSPDPMLANRLGVSMPKGGGAP
jgi:hypothetical protein